MILMKNLKYNNYLRNGISPIDLIMFTSIFLYFYFVLFVKNEIKIFYKNIKNIK